MATAPMTPCRYGPMRTPTTRVSTATTVTALVEPSSVMVRSGESRSWSSSARIASMTA